MNQILNMIVIVHFCVTKCLGMLQWLIQKFHNKATLHASDNIGYFIRNTFVCVLQLVYVIKCMVV